MHFIVTAYDGTDENAYQRRLDAREAHLANAKRMIADLRADWLAAEPYVTGGAWEKIEIAPCKVPDFCLDTRWMHESL